MTISGGGKIVIVAAWLLSFASADVWGGSYASADGIIGASRRHKVNHNESLLEIARRFDLGYNETVDANAGVDPFIPPPGTFVNIPTSWILPEVQLLDGIVINIPELRLYLLSSEHPDTVETFPVGIGDAGSETPVGTFTIVEKTVGPSWHVPESIRLQNPSLPRIVPPGPDNPMGSHALRLSLWTILIHGTDKPWGIGRNSSHGCIRLYPEDIVQLFDAVSTGTSVAIVHQPVKAAVKGEKIFLEVHRAEQLDYLIEAIDILAEKDLIGRVDFTKLQRELERKSGVPVDITREVAPLKETL